MIGHVLSDWRPIAIPRPWVVVGAVLLVCVSCGTNESVKPGINESFQDPNVEQFITIFEGESREIYAHRHEIVDALGLTAGTDVADIGAGTGFFSRMIAEQVAPDGTVFAVDIAENFLDHIDETSEQQGLTNIETVHCTQTSTELPPNSVDVAFVCDTYHHFEYPFETLASIHQALRPEGKLVIVDFERIKGVSDEWVLGHVRAGKGTFTDEVKDSGFVLDREIDLGMEGQYVLQFSKRGPESDG